MYDFHILQIFFCLQFMCSNSKKKKNVIKILFFLYITKNNAIPSLSFFSSNKKVYNLNINLSEKIHYLGEFFYKFIFKNIYIYKM